MHNRSSQIIEQLPPDIDDTGWSKIKLKQLELKNFGKFDHILVDFTSESIQNDVEQLSCLVGPNGTGKTTILTAIQMLFSRYGEYEQGRYEANMLKYARNVQQNKEQDFLIKGTFEYIVDDVVGCCSSSSSDIDGEYCVELTRMSKPSSFHPKFVANRLPHYCFFTRLDQELHTFQLKRNRWNKFKSLFESITGYEINESESMFDVGEDTRMKNVLKKYVTSFSVKKPDETINYKQCSAGERKLIKTFSTLLNKSVCPNIILIDNAVMHIEVGRHIAVLDAIKKCFDQSQVIVTCHSEPIRRMLSGQKMLIDMRFAGKFRDFCDQSYRLRVWDELMDIREKLEHSSLSCTSDCLNVRGDVESALRALYTYRDGDDREFFKKIFDNISHKAYNIINDDLFSTSCVPGIRCLWRC
jgi:ABC-type cobalamin/Fe3+-siderophores transport system ATPase subunit